MQATRQGHRKAGKADFACVLFRRDRTLPFHVSREEQGNTSENRSSGQNGQNQLPMMSSPVINATIGE